jgi:signal peptidase I
MGVAEDKVSSIRFSAANMEPTISVGATLRVDRAYYSNAEPKRGDIILFRRPDDPRTAKIDESKQEFVSRIIGISGDYVAVQKKTVTLNGKDLSEPYAQWSAGGWKSYPKTLVPGESVFVLGDNRDFSKDSRFFSEVFVKYSDILAKVAVD